MPLLTRTALRLALVWMIVGVALGSVMLATKGGVGPAISLAYIGFHVEALLAGFFIQFAMAVAFWILPRYSRPAPSRGREWVFGGSVIALNVGVLASLCSAALGWPLALVAARISEVMATALFAAHAWPRVKAFNA